jgi:hypothetical protein
MRGQRGESMSASATTTRVKTHKARKQYSSPATQGSVSRHGALEGLPWSAHTPIGLAQQWRKHHLGLQMTATPGGAAAAGLNRSGRSPRLDLPALGPAPEAAYGKRQRLDCTYRPSWKKGDSSPCAAFRKRGTRVLMQLVSHRVRNHASTGLVTV